MIEIIVTSFPFLIRLAYLRWQGMPVTFYNVHRALFLWAILALIVFFAVFYYYPKSYTGITPFRTVPVVAETGGTVTEVFVKGGDHVKEGDVLFSVDDTTQKAEFALAQSQLHEVQAAMSAAQIDVDMAKAAIDAAKAGLAQVELTKADQIALRAKGSAAFRQSELERAITMVQTREAEVRAAASQLERAKTHADEILPAQLASAQASLDKANITLAKTRTKSRVSGTVEQVTLNEGARAVPMPMSPVLLLVPDREGDARGRIVAGFSQVSRTEIYEGMAAEVACESNFSITMKDTVMPARITRVQEPISSGAVAPGGRLMEPGERVKRGQVVVHMDLVHEQHKELLVPGGTCMVQLYTTSLDGELEGSVTEHVVAALGIIKAVGLRIRAWLGLASGIGLASSGH
jgi:multidrug resistance efflux pump